jgi:hypothetical protein
MECVKRAIAKANRSNGRPLPGYAPASRAAVFIFECGGADAMVTEPYQENTERALEPRWLSRAHLGSTIAQMAAGGIFSVPARNLLALRECP